MKKFIIRVGKTKKTVETKDPYSELKKISGGSLKVSSTITPVKKWVKIKGTK